MLNSQMMRSLSPEADALWLGSGRSVEDLSKPQVLVESTHGDSHPGSRHLRGLSDAVRHAVYASQCMPAEYTATDICDGVATGHEGMFYSLVSRDVLADLVEIHARASAFDAVVAISSCDKSVPAHLMAIARLDLPSVHLCGGSMAPGPAFISADSCYETDLRVAEGSMTREEELYVQRNACPTCGACQYMGTASTMQAMSEALGMSLPGCAMVPAGTAMQLELAHDAGRAVCRAIASGPRPSEIMSPAAFANAIKIHAAIGGSANAVLHLPAIAAELGIELTLADFERCSSGVPMLTRVMTHGRWPTQLFWYAGGVPRIVRELRDMLDLSVVTATGRTLCEDLDALEREGFFRRSDGYLANFGMTSQQIIKGIDEPEEPDGGLTILTGSIAPGGAVIKHIALDRSMRRFVGSARVFDDERSAVEAIYADMIRPGDVVVIRYVGRRAAGMPEMLKATDAICNKPELRASTALITDGRFSGASRGPCVGYILPEAADGGPIALLRDGDKIEIDTTKRRIELATYDAERVLASRRADLSPRTIRHKGALRRMEL